MKNGVRFIFVCAIMMALQSPSLAAEGCGLQAVDVSTPHRLEETLGWSLWTFRSDAWNGYIDFQGNGRYWTHWGYGRWTVGPDGAIEMTNDYDAYHHQITITQDGTKFRGSRNDGVEVSGELLCGQYYGVIPSGPGLDEAKATITGYYHELLGRDPDPAGLQFWLGLYQKGTSLQDIKQGIIQSTEYQQKNSVGTMK